MERPVVKWTTYKKGSMVPQGNYLVTIIDEEDGERGVVTGSFGRLLTMHDMFPLPGAIKPKPQDGWQLNYFGKCKVVAYCRYPKGYNGEVK